MSQSDITKKVIAESMKKLMRTRNFDKITVEDVCEEAGVSRRSFYRHFKDKYELLEWDYDTEFCSKIRPIMSKDKSIWDYYPAICEYLYNDREFFRKAFSFYGQNSFRSFCADKLFPLIMNDFGNIYPDEKTARFIERSYVYITFDAFVWWLSQDPCMPWQEYVEFSEKLIKDTAEGINYSFEKYKRNNL